MPYLVLDLEMTGPDPGWNEIIQIGAVLFGDDWQQLGTYLQNVYPEDEESFTAASEKIHGLSLDDLDDAPMVYDVLPEFEEWILKKLNRGSHPGHAGIGKLLMDVVVCGQSVIHDINFLQFAYRNEKMEWPFSRKLVDLHTLAFLMFKILAANGKKTPRSLSLKAISAYFGYEREEGTHNALEDAELTARCFVEFFKISSRLKIDEA
jgi:DNA polymerase-3 subunit epsilon